MGLRALIPQNIYAMLTGSNDFATPNYELPRGYDTELLSGTGANQVDKIFADQRSLATGATEDLDLVGTALTDPFGVAVSFTKVKGIFIKAADTNTTDLTIGNGTNPFVGWFGAGAHTLKVPPGGIVFLSAPVNGLAPVASTGDILKVANAAGATATYNIVIIGTSA
jgi:hypothetical protein